MVNCVHFPSFCCSSICSDKHGQERFLYQGECRESCPVGHYPAEGHTCLPCPDNCDLCHSAHICTRCMGGYFIVPTNHTCQKLECGQGKAALGPPGGGMGNGTPRCPTDLYCLLGLLSMPEMTLYDYILCKDSHSYSSLLTHTPVLWVSPDAIQGYRNAANHKEIDLEWRVCRQVMVERKSD